MPTAQLTRHHPSIDGRGSSGCAWQFFSPGLEDGLGFVGRVGCDGLVGLGGLVGDDGLVGLGLGGGLPLPVIAMSAQFTNVSGVSLF